MTPARFSGPPPGVAARPGDGLQEWNRRLGGGIAAVLTLLEGFSLVYLGEHYPHDVVAAFVLGTAIMVIGWVLLRRPIDRLIGRLEDTALRTLLTTRTAAPGAWAPPPSRTGSVATEVRLACPR
jgi:membrane-associated phospholipid phosphatase